MTTHASIFSFQSSSLRENDDEYHECMRYAAKIKVADVYVNADTCYYDSINEDHDDDDCDYVDICEKKQDDCEELSLASLGMTWRDFF